MRRRVLAVPRPQAESVRRGLKERGWLSTEQAVVRRGELVLLPLDDAAEGPFDAGTVEVVDLPAPARTARSYRDLFPTLSSADRRALPRSFDVVGDVVLVRLPERLADQAPAIGAALLEFVPGARKVGWDHGVQGPARRRQLQALAGTGDWRTHHRENGLVLEVDLERAYFSPRLAREHARVAALVRAGERVLDLCCGIGPFALTIARDGRAREVVAVDSNPDAIALLEANARRLGVAGLVRAHIADVAEFVARGGTAERITFNLPHEGIKYLTSVGAAVEGGGMLHFYEIMERSRAASRPSELAALLGPHGAWSAAPARVVHAYSPTADLVAQTLTRSVGRR